MSAGQGLSTLKTVDSKPADASAPEPAMARVKPDMVLRDSLRFAYDTFLTNRVRFMLTALGMVIGTASIILVTTIGLTGQQYVLNQIQAIGTNEIWVEYQGGQHVSKSCLDPLTVEDVEAVQQMVPGIAAASPVVTLSERIPVGNGEEKEVQILGVFPGLSARAQPENSFRTLF